MTATLDESAKNGINEISRRYRRGTFAHEILCYGVDAAAHYHLLTQAQQTINKTSTLDGFIKKYQLKFQDPHLRGIGGFLGTLEPMAHEGLFIPEGRENKSIVFFDLDYLNKLGRPRRENGFLVRREDPFELSDRTWKPEDLGNSELIERGLGYSRELWKISTEDFERQVKKTECAEPMPAEVIGIARKLISYYEGIVSRK